MVFVSLHAVWPLLSFHAHLVSGMPTAEPSTTSTATGLMATASTSQAGHSGLGFCPPQPNAYLQRPGTAPIPFHTWLRSFKGYVCLLEFDRPPLEEGIKKTILLNGRTQASPLCERTPSLHRRTHQTSKRCPPAGPPLAHCRTGAYPQHPGHRRRPPSLLLPCENFCLTAVSMLSISWSTWPCRSWQVAAPMLHANGCFWR